MTYFRAASGYTYLDAPVTPPLSVLLFSALPLQWNPSIVSVADEDPLRPAIHAHIRVLLRGLHPRLNPRRLRLGDEWIIRVDFRAIPEN